VGFELYGDLNEVARNNIKKFSKQVSVMAPIELVTGDATQLPLPDAPLVLYLFNPLGPEAMIDFAAALKASYLRNPRKIICIYYNTAHPGPLEDIDIFPKRELAEYPHDPCDRYEDFNFKALIYETKDQI
jgi:hypothetical protein